MIDVKKFIKMGYSATVEMVVSDQDTASHFGSGRLGDLLATPALVKLMIEAAVKAADPHLPKGFVTVGTAMHYTHTAPTVVGSMVRATATVSEIIGSYIIFTITASDNLGEIGKGSHERAIVAYDDLMKKSAERAMKISNIPT